MGTTSSKLPGLQTIGARNDLGQIALGGEVELAVGESLIHGRTGALEESVFNLHPDQVFQCIINIMFGVRGSDEIAATPCSSIISSS
jgi:hypothetical protein